VDLNRIFASFGRVFWYQQHLYPTDTARSRLMGKCGLPQRVLEAYAGGSLRPRAAGARYGRANPLWCVHCAHFLDAAACDTMLAAAGAHVAAHGYTTGRHPYHPTNDFDVRDCAALARRLDVAWRTVVAPTMAALFMGGGGGGGRGHSSWRRDLVLREAFFVRYTPGAQSALAPHRDGHLLSFNILLSEPDSFGGGGTRFLGGVEPPLMRPERRGDLTLHCGKLLHEGVAVTSGVRYIVVGFVDATAAAAGRVDLPFLASRHANHSKAGKDHDYTITGKCWKHEDDEVAEGGGCEGGGAGYGGARRRGGGRLV
jgi:hypothetical protein